MTTNQPGERIFLNPRQVSPELLEGVDISAQSFPCGLQECAALAVEACEETGTDRNQAVLSCARRMAITAVRGQLSESEAENTALQEQRALDEELIQRLSVDRKTGLLTYNTQSALLEDMLSGGLLEQMRRRGYVMELLIFDLDRLKLHNALGAHEGGDVALAAAAHALRTLYRRKSDLIGYTQHYQDAREAIVRGEGTKQLGRFETGDEIIGFSFIPPHQFDPTVGDRRKPLTSLDRRLSMINEAMSGVRAVYPLQTAVSRQQLREEHGPLIFDYTVDGEGRVHAPVSGTFALTLAPVPSSMHEFEGLFRTVDGAMANAKTGRVEIATQGVMLNLLASSGTS